MMATAKPVRGKCPKCGKTFPDRSAAGTRAKMFAASDVSYHRKMDCPKDINSNANKYKRIAAQKKR
jgi:hypothetical protein